MIYSDNFVCAHMCSCVQEGVCVYTFAHACGGQSRVWLSLPWNFPSSLGWLSQWSPRVLPSHLPGAAITSVHRPAWLLHVGSGDQTQVLKLAKQALYQWCPLCSPDNCHNMINYLACSATRNVLSLPVWLTAHTSRREGLEGSRPWKISCPHPWLPSLPVPLPPFIVFSWSWGLVLI